MKFTLVPEYIFDTFDVATADFLLSIGVKAVLLDIDNTLEPYEHPTPSKHVLEWLESLKNAGISTAIISNNNHSRVEEFNKNIGMPAFAKAGKPFTGKIKHVLRDMTVTPDEVIFIGDQILTDVWAAHNAGMRAILVPPINDKRDLFTRFKRLIERPIIKKYHKNNKKEDNK